MKSKLIKKISVKMSKKKNERRKKRKKVKNGNWISIKKKKEMKKINRKK